MSILADNRKAYFNYEVLEKYEAGIKLTGMEVKAIRAGKASLVGAFCILRGNEVFIVNMNISPYQVSNTKENYDPLKVRKLLLSKKEILELEKTNNSKNLTLIPLSLYTKNRHIKLELAVARGKKNYDKRETIKKRDLDREVKRNIDR